MNSLAPAERAFIDGHRVARLATSDLHGAPHVIPIVYAYVDEAVYFIVDDKPKRTHSLKRLRNIEQNPQVALLIDDYDEDWNSLAYLLIHGRADLVSDRLEFVRLLSALRARYPQYQSMALAFDSHALVRIAIEQAHFWRATPP